jgi:hypothetical protein
MMNEIDSFLVLGLFCIVFWWLGLLEIRLRKVKSK